MDIVTFIIAIIGIGICFKKMQTLNNIYRYGLWFFALIGLSEIISLLFTVIIDINDIPFLGTDLKNLSWFLAIVRLPERIVYWVGFIVLMLGFYRQKNNQ